MKVQQKSNYQDNSRKVLEMDMSCVPKYKNCLNIKTAPT